MTRHGNTEGPDRPVDNPNYSEYMEINPKPDLTGRDLMSADLDDKQSDYQGWNGVDNIDPSQYGDLPEE